MSANESQVSGRREFASTHWSLVLDAARDDGPDCAQALATLCESYWYPLYAFVRRQGYEAADAQDLTQGFFVRLLEKRDLAGVDRAKGRFRAYLLASLKHFLINEWDKARAVKRGGGRPALSLDFGAAEGRYRVEPAHQQTAEAIFDREWGLQVLEQVRSQLAEEYQGDKREQYEVLGSFLTGQAVLTSYREAAERLGTSEGAVKVAVHRLRRRFRHLLRERISETVASEEEVGDEIRALFTALRGA